MQKKIIALAVAGLVSGAAFAQSNVTVYGVADVYYGYASAKTNTPATATQDSSHSINSGGLAGSRIGFKGVEDLGNGNKALFVLEYALAMDQNMGITSDQALNNARQQIVGLTGNWGTVVGGFAQTAGYDFSCATNPLAGGALDAQGKLSVGGTALLTCGAGGRSGNAFAYISPTFSGFTFAYNHARVTENAGGNTHASITNYGAGGATADDNYANLLSAGYANGPISAGLTWSKISGGTGDVVAGDITEVGLRGAYDFGVAKLWAHWQKNDNDVTNQNNNKWSLSVSAPVTANGTISAMYSKANIDVAAGAASQDAKSWSIAYVHAMSKRTKLYGGYNKVSNDAAANRASLVNPDAGNNSSVLAVGVNHAF